MQSGVRPGQRLLTVSDPINMGEDLEIVPGDRHTATAQYLDASLSQNATQRSY